MVKKGRMELNGDRGERLMAGEKEMLTGEG
jgi:hypothetical protein